MNLTKKSLFIIVFLIIFVENSIIIFADIEEKEHYSHQIIVINSLIALIIAILVLLQESEDKNFHLKTRIPVVLGLSCWFLANLVWAIYSIILDVVPPVPSIGDVLWLSAYGFLGFHLLISLKKFKHRFNKKLIGAGILVGVVFLTFMTYFTLSISSFENSRGISMFIILLLYPLFASLLLIFSIILHVGLRKDTYHAVPWMFDSLATIAIVVADSWFVIVVITNTVSEIWIASLFISAHYLIMVAGLFWYSKYLTHKSDTSILNKCYNNIKKKQVFSIVGILIVIVITFYTIPNPLNTFNISSLSHHKHANEIGVVYAPTDFEEIRLGALLPITGTLSSVGESGLVTLNIVTKDINNYLDDINSPYRIKILVEDTGTNPEIALKKLKLLKEKGVDIVIGPASSASTMHLKNYTDENGIMLIGFSSTAPSLSVAEDNIFRLIPDDSYQAKAISKKMWHDGIRVIVPFVRSDVYGNDLLNFTETNFEDLGGIVVEGIKYKPPIGQFAASLNRINYVFWGQELLTLNSKVKELATEYTLNEIGIYLIAFDEIVPILSQANSHPLLEKVRWYGSEATVKYEKIISNYESSVFAANSKYVAPLYGFNETDNKKLESFLEAYDEYDTEAILTFDGPYLYDAVWLAAFTKIKSNNTNEVELLKSEFINISNSYTGITGPTILNEFGDRLYSSYDFWSVSKKKENDTANNNRLEWIKIG
ncbi:MAG: ABC transporter substrate-binding protein [Nitrososphaeraceae archaeon]